MSLSIAPVQPEPVQPVEGPAWTGRGDCRPPVWEISSGGGVKRCPVQPRRFDQGRKGKEGLAAGRTNRAPLAQSSAGEEFQKLVDIMARLLPAFYQWFVGRAMGMMR
mgnify:CR=1 FL=1